MHFGLQKSWGWFCLSTFICLWVVIVYVIVFVECTHGCTSVTMSVFVQLIERAGRAADDEKVEQKMAESWEELSLVSPSPTLIRKGIEGVVMKHVAKATKQQKGIWATESGHTNTQNLSCVTPSVIISQLFSFHSADLCQQPQMLDVQTKPESKSKRLQLCALTLQVHSDTSPLSPWRERICIQSQQLLCSSSAAVGSFMYARPACFVKCSA